jgi:2-iminobutanoate/2-iminopropanoate deaminase
MKKVNSDEVFASGAPLVQGMRTDDLVFVSGQIPRTSDGEILTDDVEEQTEQVMENIQSILQSEGLSLDDVIRTGVYLKDSSQFGPFNEVYEEYMNEPYPARSAIVVADLAKGVDVEVDVIAVA